MDTLYLLVCEKNEELDRKIKAQYQVIFQRPALLPKFQEYLLLFPDGITEEALDDFMESNTDQPQYSIAIY
jgi:hypothetical protein